MQRARGWQDYHARLERVMAHIHDHLAQDLDLDGLAALAHMSAYHWHRIWHAMYGETLAGTVRRLRLQRGSGLLAHASMPVAEVARRCGYPNSQSFSRAFREAYGMTPSDYRRSGSHLRFDHGIAAGSEPDSRIAHEVEVRAVPVVRLAGLDHRGSYMGIGKAFEGAFGWMTAAGLVHAGTRWLAVYFDDPFAVPEAQLHSRAGLSLADAAQAPPPLQAFELGGGLCAVLRYRGPYADMRAAYRWLYSQWLPRAGYELADRPVFEEYLNHPRGTAPADLLTDIFLPLVE